MTSRINEELADELAEFCRRGRIVQEGAIEAAIYWLVHCMGKDEYLEVTDAASAYLDGKATSGEAGSMADFQPATAMGRKLKGKGGLGRGAQKDAARGRRAGR